MLIQFPVTGELCHPIQHTKEQLSTTLQFFLLFNEVPVPVRLTQTVWKKGNDSTVRGDGGGRVGEVRAGTTSPMPEHKGFMLQ